MLDTEDSDLIVYVVIVSQCSDFHHDILLFLNAIISPINGLERLKSGLLFFTAPKLQPHMLLTTVREGEVGQGKNAVQLICDC